MTPHMRTLGSTTCQQCGGPNFTTGTMCVQCTVGLLTGQVFQPKRCSECGQVQDIAGVYCSACLREHQP